MEFCKDSVEVETTCVILRFSLISVQRYDPGETGKSSGLMLILPKLFSGAQDTRDRANGADNRDVQSEYVLTKQLQICWIILGDNLYANDKVKDAPEESNGGDIESFWGD